MDFYFIITLSFASGAKVKQKFIRNVMHMMLVGCREKKESSGCYAVSRCKKMMTKRSKLVRRRRRRWWRRGWNCCSCCLTPHRGWICCPTGVHLVVGSPTAICCIWICCRWSHSGISTNGSSRCRQEGLGTGYGRSRSYCR